MNWLDDPDRIKVSKQIIALNAFAAIVNLALFVWNLYTLNWIGILNLGCFFFSSYQVHKIYKQLPEIRRNQEQKILNILKGKYT